MNNSEQRLIDAEQRALVAEEQISRLDEQLKVCYKFSFDSNVINMN